MEVKVLNRTRIHREITDERCSCPNQKRYYTTSLRVLGADHTFSWLPYWGVISSRNRGRQSLETQLSRVSKQWRRKVTLAETSEKERDFGKLERVQLRTWFGGRLKSKRDSSVVWTRKQETMEASRHWSPWVLRLVQSRDQSTPATVYGTRPVVEMSSFLVPER